MSRSFRSLHLSAHLICMSCAWSNLDRLGLANPPSHHVCPASRCDSHALAHSGELFYAVSVVRVCDLCVRTVFTHELFLTRSCNIWVWLEAYLTVASFMSLHGTCLDPPYSFEYDRRITKTHMWQVSLLCVSMRYLEAENG